MVFSLYHLFIHHLGGGGFDTLFIIVNSLILFSSPNLKALNLRLTDLDILIISFLIDTATYFFFDTIHADVLSDNVKESGIKIKWN